jgi:hypothetical protein
MDGRALPLLASDAPSALLTSPLAQRLLTAGLELIRRAPGADPQRWRRHSLGGRDYQFAQPLTLTPYASSQPCSARCHFCSENLRRPDAVAASALRPGPRYFAGLRRALDELRGLPRSYSLSGLEASDDADWLLQLLECLSDPADRADVEQRVLYANGAGLAGPRGAELLAALEGFGLSWLELSRHHHEAAANQRIMRFRPGLAVAGEAGLRRLVGDARERFPVKLVCLLQRGGIDSPEGVARYLDWAAHLGADTVIFRELSRLDGGYRANATARYVEEQRVSLEPLLQACLDDPALGLQAEALTDGYYFWNLQARHRTGLRLVFECSDYRTMHRRHAEGRVYKLVYFANGQLCAGWQPGQDLLLECLDG